MSHDIFHYYDLEIKILNTPPAGLEPATYRLTADRSANWAMEYNDYHNVIHYKQKIHLKFQCKFCM